MGGRDFRNRFAVGKGLRNSCLRGCELKKRPRRCDCRHRAIRVPNKHDSARHRMSGPRRSKWRYENTIDGNTALNCRLGELISDSKRTLQMRNEF
jgi:hypothetical protein